MKKTIKLFETFSGIGAQTKAFKNIAQKNDLNIENVGISEWYIDAIISYSKIHHLKEFNDLKSKIENDKNNVYPKTKVEIIQEYEKNPNYVFSSNSKNPSMLKNIKEAKLKELYIANIVSKNFGSIAEIKGQELPDDIDIFTYSFPCFTAGHKVMTNKGYINIEDIKKGDMVLTHKNRFKPVVIPMKKFANKIYELKTPASEKIFVTEEHPFLVKKVIKNFWNNGKNPTRKMILSNSEWKTIKELKENDNYKNYKIGVAINQESRLPIWNGVQDLRFTKHTKYINELEKLFKEKDFWWLIGLYIGDGWTQIREKDYYYKTIVCASKKNEQYIKIERKLNNMNIKFHKVEERTTYKYHIVSKELTFFLEQFGKYAHGKRLNETIFDLPVIYLKKFIQGYLFADGSFNKKTNEYKIESVSSELIYGVNQCLLKAYKTYGRIQYSKRPPFYEIEGRIVNQRDTYSIRFSIKNRKQSSVKFDENTYWYPIKNIELTDKKEYVYNFEVDEDNSYTIYNLIAHNCQALSLQGKQGGLAKDSETTSSLVWQVLRILEEAKAANKLPKVLLMENVKALFSKKFIDTWKEIVEILDSYGYNTYDTIINAVDKGSIQRRERVFGLSILKELDKGFQFNSEDSKKNNKTLKDVLEDNIDNKFFMNQLKEKIENEEFKMKTSGICSLNLQNYTTFQSENILYSIDGKSPTLTASGANSRIKIIDNNGNLRYLTPIEFWQLMGFDKKDVEINDNLSNAALYRLAGNSISVEALEDIFEDILKWVDL